jgi:Tfp pilus assembly protein PilO
MKEKNKSSVNNLAALLLLLVAVAFAGALLANGYYMPRFKSEFTRIEKERITVSNKLATAMIVQENLNHVRDLIFNNMEVQGRPDTVNREALFFEFITACVNDLKLKLVSVKPAVPVTDGRITAYGYDVVIEGDFFRFGELCAKFENNPMIVSIESFDVNLISDIEREKRQSNTDFKTENKGISVRMRINTYWISKADPQAAAEADQQGLTKADQQGVINESR